MSNGKHFKLCVSAWCTAIKQLHDVLVPDTQQLNIMHDELVSSCYILPVKNFPIFMDCVDRDINCNLMLHCDCNYVVLKRQLHYLYSRIKAILNLNQVYVCNYHTTLLITYILISTKKSLEL